MLFLDPHIFLCLSSIRGHSPWRLPGATFAIVDIITFHHSDHVHDPDLDLDRFGKAAQPTEAVPTVWSLSALATAPVLAPAAPNMLIDIIEMPSTGVQMGTHPSDKSRSPMACHYDSIRLRLIIGARIGSAILTTVTDTALSSLTSFN
ncbi:hypothetical protein CCUS01_01864 [Colletotrichum cuscutae]|uniref:Uncharacterized protein n=1 Tax=Colletotrichum cuscutae TaxID=1209917 RepID=A0AAI9U6V7_9PEZI|nr:hypothetical protein CCUS01_01864 [Colletotrichum cuscutae]